VPRGVVGPLFFQSPVLCQSRSPRGRTRRCRRQPHAGRYPPGALELRIAAKLQVRRCDEEKQKRGKQAPAPGGVRATSVTSAAGSARRLPSVDSARTAASVCRRDHRQLNSWHPAKIVANELDVLHDSKSVLEPDTFCSGRVQVCNMRTRIIYESPAIFLRHSSCDYRSHAVVFRPDCSRDTPRFVRDAIPGYSDCCGGCPSPETR
jgi:hypothetical protein